MTAYLALLGARFRVLLQYRTAALAGLGTQLFWGLIRMQIFQAFYDSAPGPQPMSRADTVTYLWLGQAMLVLIPWNLDSDIRAMVRTGTVAYELLRPMDLYSTWYMRALAQRTAPTLLRCVPILVVSGVFFGLRPPPSFTAGLAWLLTTATAVAADHCHCSGAKLCRHDSYERYPRDDSVRRGNCPVRSSACLLTLRNGDTSGSASALAPSGHQFSPISRPG